MQQEPEALEFSLPERTTSGLWNVVHGDESLDDRCLALDTLMHLGEEKADTFLLEQLEREDLSAEERDAFVALAERSRWMNIALRKRLTDRLMVIGQAMLAEEKESEVRTIWCILRKFASMAPEEEAGKLLPFLHAQIHETRHSAMQNIAVLFSVQRKTTDVPDQEKIGDALLAIAETGLEPEYVDTLRHVGADRNKKIPPGVHKPISGTLNAIQALLALDDPRVISLIERVRELLPAWAFVLEDRMRLQQERWDSYWDPTPGQRALP